MIPIDFSFPQTKISIQGINKIIEDNFWAYLNCTNILLIFFFNLITTNE